jgi:hypothetical protein
VTTDLLSVGSLGYLSRPCRRWGGELVVLDSDAFQRIDMSAPGVSLSPDLNHAIDIPNRCVMADALAPDAGAVIHEMGHLFLIEGDPPRIYEPDWLGWEIALARRARCYPTWNKQNATYQVPFKGGDFEWASITGAARRRLVTDRIAHAKRIGIVSQDDKPLCTRLP